jgi:hypothetical protein
MRLPSNTEATPILPISPDPPKMSADLAVTVDLDDVETIKLVLSPRVPHRLMEWITL